MEKNKIMYNVYKYILGLLFIAYYRPKIVNKKYIPKKGPVIIAGNHIHLFDQCLPILSTKRMIHYMAKKEYFEGKTAWFFKSSGCISVDRGNKENAKIAINTATNLLKDGYAVGIFPEGTRNKTEDLLLPFKIGAVKMAKETDATIVPFVITGEYKFWNNNLKVTFLKPFKVNNMTLEYANKRLRNMMLKELKKYNN